MSSLWSEFLNNTGRIAHKWTHYFPVYERHFAKFRNRAITFLEIGTGEGGSAGMWKRWLGPLARIISIDIRPECMVCQDEQIAVRIGSQSDPSFLRRVVKEFGPPDAVVDDGSHLQSDIIASFEFLYPLVSKEGVYLVEDLHTSYWPNFGGALRQPGTFIEFAKRMIDEMNEAAKLNTPAGMATQSICFYESIAVFEKMPRLFPLRDFRTGSR